MLAAVLEAAGYRAGLFTSPHLTRVEERIQVGGQPIAPAELAALMEEIRAAAADLVPAPTFFEIGTALGFLHFVRRRVDFAIVEVGLGGRFDSTNVCRPLAAIITTISLDHTQVLGDTAELIAREGGDYQTGPADHQRRARGRPPPRHCRDVSAARCSAAADQRRLPLPP